MAAPHIHALSSVKKYGGKMEDYIEIHAKMDCSKGYLPDIRHRALTHTMFWVLEVMVPLYGHTMTNSDDKMISVKDICEDHILEDYRQKFIPTPQDFLQHIDPQEWMQNGKSTTELDEDNGEVELPLENLDFPRDIVFDGNQYRGPSMTID